MPFIESDGIRFHYALSGAARGPLVAFQHGLGGDVSQPHGVLGDSVHLRVLSLDCRGHGRTEPLGPSERLTFADFADDLRAVLDALRIGALIVGGISMGAGVALNFALRYPARVHALILSRPAWLDVPCPPNLAIFRTLSRWIKEVGPQRAKELLLTDPEFRRIQAVSRDNAASILRQLERPSPETTIATLASLPADAPCPAPEGWRAVGVPTLVLVNELDALHPVEYGRRLAAGIPGAQLVQIAPKEQDPALHTREAREAIEAFVRGL
ncbi:MAG: alpha/beta fold hydrolase [Verrucomicrobia bacterium]|nr:alpha/beta fold hydrolase [Verrucomicrobiota bacterium]